MSAEKLAGARKDKLLLIESAWRCMFHCRDALSIARSRPPAKGCRGDREDRSEGSELAVESGQSLSGALVARDPLAAAIVGLISCGESSGARSHCDLEVGPSLMERQDELLKKCLSALTYPTVIGLAAVGLTVGLVRGVMPQIIPLLLGCTRICRS
jgi:hypothetical protein